MNETQPHPAAIRAAEKIKDLMARQGCISDKDKPAWTELEQIITREYEPVVSAAKGALQSARFLLKNYDEGTAGANAYGKIIKALSLLTK